MTGSSWPVPARAQRSRRCTGPPDCPCCWAGPPLTLSDRSFLAANGVRIALQGHHPFYASIKAVYDTLKYLRDGGAPSGLKDRVASEELLNIAMKRDDYKRWQSDYLR